MLSERVQHQGKAGFLGLNFKMIFLKIPDSAN